MKARDTFSKNQRLFLEVLYSWPEKSFSAEELEREFLRRVQQNGGYDRIALWESIQEMLADLVSYGSLERDDERYWLSPAEA